MEELKHGLLDVSVAEGQDLGDDCRIELVSNIPRGNIKDDRKTHIDPAGQ